MLPLETFYMIVLLLSGLLNMAIGAVFFAVAKDEDDSFFMVFGLINYSVGFALLIGLISGVIGWRL